MKNSIGREIPDEYGKGHLYNGAFSVKPDMKLYAPPVKAVKPGSKKLMESIEDVFKRIPIQDGMTLSFHHHLRNGDYVLNMVLAVADKLNIKNLNIAISSVFPIHEPLIEYIKKGVVTGIDTDYMSGPVAKAISKGILKRPVIFRTHGGRARAIASGQLKIDVAFLAAPAADMYGNINGIEGATACGSLGYALVDARYADCVVAITDHLRPYPLIPASINQTEVDYVVVVDSIGDPEGIISGTTQLTKNPISLSIAKKAADVIEASGLLKEGFSFQTGAGGASLATAAFLKEKMEQKHICGNFALGGITKYIVEMQKAGLFRVLFDSQSFDLDAVKSIRTNSNHVEISADMYANPFNKGCVVNQLDVAVLGATEIDTDFNVNVITGSNGVIMGGSGGHSDAAAGAKMTMIVTPLIRKRLPIIVDKVTTVSTPGETVDVVVTERGIAVNPRRKELRDALIKSGISIVNINELKEKAESLTGKPDIVTHEGPVVGLVEYRDGTLIDVIHKV